MKINKKILAVAIGTCLPVAILVANCATSWTPAWSPGFANPDGYCDSTCHNDSYGIDGACGASAAPGQGGTNCTLDAVWYGYNEYAPRWHYDEQEDEYYCTCDNVYWELTYYLVPHLSGPCVGKPVANPGGPLPPP